MTTKSKSARIIALALLILPVHLRCGLALGADALEKPIAAPAEEGPARPSNPGGTGPAVSLTGNAGNGAVLYRASCEKCHGPEGQGAVPNPGSTDGTVPALNPIDPSIAGISVPEFVTNTDLFLEHGSRPDGPKPEQEMPAWGDSKILEPQQLADLIAYIVLLNKAPTPGAQSSP